MAERKAADVYIANEPFAVKAYQRSLTDDMVARFGSTERGQTNLDLLKAVSQKSFRGGMFQRSFTDDEMVSSISNAIYNKLDDKLYFAPKMTEVSHPYSMDTAGISSWCYFKGSLYYSFTSEYPAPVYNRIHKYDVINETITSITLPATLQNSVDPIRLTAYDDYIYIGAKPYSPSGTDAYRYDGVTTFVAVGGGFSDFVEFRDKLYAIAHHNTLFVITSAKAATTLTWTAIKDVGPTDATTTRAFKKMIKFNGALYILMTHGLYRYDGVDVLPVIDLSKNVDNANFAHSGVFNGRLYYTIRNKLFEFDGTNIAEVQDFTESYEIKDVAGGSDRLWITAKLKANVAGADYKVNYLDGLNATNNEHALFYYDGVGFFEYQRFAAEEYINARAIPIANKIYVIMNNTTVNASLEPRSGSFYMWRASLSNEFTSTNLSNNRSFTVYGSEIDNGYPSVTKVLNGVMVDAYGFDTTNITLKLEVKTTNAGVASAWQEVWNSQNVTALGITNDYLLHDRSTAGAPNLTTSPLTYQRIQYRLTATIANGFTVTDPPSVRSVTLRYTVQPRSRRKWLLTLPLYGKDASDIEHMTLGDGTEESRRAGKLRRLVYDAYAGKYPILFYDIDFSTVAVRTNATTLTVQGTDLLADNEHVALKETAGTGWTNRRAQVVSYDEGTAITSLTLDSTGDRVGIGGSAGTGWAAGSEVRRSYAVYVRDIRNERVIIDDNTVNDYTGFSDFSSELTIELIEV